MAFLQIVSGQIIDIHNNRIFNGEIEIKSGRISKIRESATAPNQFILPGFVDAHIHIESSMLTPYEFAKMALTHGTIATVSDPHEIANVCGIEGVYYMIENAAEAKLKFNFGAPSCVPATTFETAGAELNSRDVDLLLRRNDIRYLSEMMNYPGVLTGNDEVMAKIGIARSYNKPVDGHAPGMTGADAVKYIEAGISTDHECFTKEEALHKLKHGMKILIREGSAARNFEALHELISEYPNMVMLCSDDKHPDELAQGHINLLVKRALGLGHNLFDVLRCASLNPVEHYKLDVGLLRENDPADFIVIDNPESFNILETYINGERVFAGGQCILQSKSHKVINNFGAKYKSSSDYVYPFNSGSIKVIEAIDGQLVTNSLNVVPRIQNGFAVADVENDILKICVINRYRDEKPAIAFVKNFGLKTGAIASSVAHDSHNIIAVGTDDVSISKAVNAIIENQGGLSAADEDGQLALPLPVAGLMSTHSCEDVAQLYSAIDDKAKKMGSTLRAPFMTLSFMALLVIPSLKLSDKGLFDGNKFEFTE